MHDVVGTLLPRLPVQCLDKVRDLIYFEGPLCSEFRSPLRDSYIVHWCDADAEFTRVMVVRVTRHRIAQYLRKKITLRDMLNHPRDGFVYVTDCGSNLEPARVWLCLARDVQEYMPRIASWYDENFAGAQS